MKKLLLAFVLGCAITSAWSQKELKKANSYFATRQYVEAAEEYKIAGPKIKDLTIKAQSYYNVGECYRMMTRYNEAIEWYDKSGRAMYGKTNPELHYNWGLCYEMQGKYEEAVAQFKRYQESGGDREKGNQAIKLAQNAADLKNQKTKIEVEMVGEISTPEFDFAMNYGAKKGKDGDVFILSSSRKSSAGSGADPKTGEDFMDLFTVTRDPKGKFGTPVALDKMINSENNEGPISFTKDFGEMYFTFCQYETGEYHPCEIRMSKVQNDKFEAPIKVVFDKTNGDSVVFGHPCLTPDNKHLIFASNLPGGKGGMDLWYSSYDKKNDQWGAPKNLGSMNTSGDEMFPWMEDNTLYFSSNAIAGLGGFDLFKSTKGEDMSFSAPTNLGYPINSSSDDFALIIDRSAKKLYNVEFAGFFTSNRPGGKGKDDIYQFRDVPVLFTMQGYVYDDKTGAPVEGASVMVKSTDGAEYKLTTDKSGAFNLDNTQVLAENTYMVDVDKLDYIGIQGDRFSTRNLKENTNFAKEYFIQPIEKDVEYHMPLVQYPYNKTELLVNETVNSQDSLNYLFDLLAKNKTWKIQLEAHTDARGSVEANQILSDGRAKTCVDYLVSKGIDARRIVPVGKGESQPITLKKDQANFKAGDIVNEEYIAKLATNEEKDVAHQLNRRTVFRILATDFDPNKPDNVPPAPAPDKGKTGTKPTPGGKPGTKKP
jgi:peptidoglycan-associated lipoprotein